jgi:DNA-binding transcriptional regulator LsrR (DeoR family)
MRKIKEVLSFRYELKLDQRQIARSCSISVSTVHEYLTRRGGQGKLATTGSNSAGEARLAAG